MAKLIETAASVVALAVDFGLLALLYRRYCEKLEKRG